MRREYDFSKGERGKFYRRNADVNLPRATEQPVWAGAEGRLCEFITAETEKTLRAYREQPSLVTEHANHEHDTARGGYAHRQLFELIQNSADALAKAPEGKGILVRLTDDYLYCADDGEVIDERGIQALMFAHMSSKRNTSEIGRFGLGFKSVLGVTDAPEFYSRPGSFRFDRQHAAKRISSVAQTERYPVLRLPIPIDAREASENDDDLRELMTWATNIVRLPLKPGTNRDLTKQFQDFPPEFLLFVEHVRFLTLEHREHSRDYVLQRVNGELRLDAGDRSSRWKCFKTTCQLSAEALEDRRSLDDSGDVPIWWAAPLDRLTDPGYYWHFFPTKTASLLAGILNGPWKTNEDRQNLLPGPYNDELIETAARLVAEHLPELTTEGDPALHLDALPRRHEAGDTEHSDQLRKRIFDELATQPIIPDQDGLLCKASVISCAPRELTQDQSSQAALKRWESFDLRPKNWLHHSALTRTRLPRLEPLFLHGVWGSNKSFRASIEGWLEALVRGRSGDEAIAASKVALQTAAAIPEEQRRRGSLGDILLAESGAWCTPKKEQVFLPSPNLDPPENTLIVHRALATDPETVASVEKLGVGHMSAETLFRSLAKKLLVGFSDDHHGGSWSDFWRQSREVGANKAYQIIHEVSVRKASVCVRVQTGDWCPLHSVLLPGAIVSLEDTDNARVAVDLGFHREDVTLLKLLRATDAPQNDLELSGEPFFASFLSRYREAFRRRPLSSEPRPDYLNFSSTVGSGPLEVLKLLSDKGKVDYTDALLKADGTYKPWRMRHETRASYPELTVPNLAIDFLKEYGRIRCEGEIIPINAALGTRPANLAALRTLLSHPMADRIKNVFDISEPVLEPVGEEDPVPLKDMWPGLEQYLESNPNLLCVIRCQDLVIDGASCEVECLRVDSNIYLIETGDDSRNLRLVLQELGLPLSEPELEQIRDYLPPPNVEELRATVRELKTDTERLLQAVGKDRLRSGLPGSLLAVLEGSSGPLSGVQLAEAAIATYHTSALREFRHALTDLAPPTQWAGSPYAVAFVKSLGFSEEWAGERSSRRPSFVEVEGPYSLPPLHTYQKQIVTNVREMLCNGYSRGTKRRGMISLPTGSGKTRVAVQAIVEAICHGFSGGVLWVADRDELCEQAVEAWRQVWSSVGSERKRLRVSRMWGGQNRPLPTNHLHVIVATIQTLNSKLSNQPDTYKFLADFNLVVFDEAHRSIAPTYTSVMQEIGLTRWQREEEPFLLGLTATPYRGHDKDETARLVRRYGGNRLDAGAFASDEPEEVIAELQAMRVLAHADHEIIDGGNFSLNQDELSKMSAMPYPAWLPPSMENRIAADVTRTRRIVESYENLVGHSRGEKWPTLIFATSVEHAKTVAALLNSRNVRSRAVSGATETTLRRDIVDKFRAGEIDVLVNYGVFREGFDAPRTRVIIVARPVYSPNLYFQMIGRGLRGPRNGGNERCLIINVRDNIYNFSKALAFSELDWLWG